MGKLYFDLDGVLRDLATAIYGCCPEKYGELYKGYDIVDYVNNGRMNILVDSPPTKYYRTIVKAYKGKTIPIITKQSDLWMPYTAQWIENYLDDYEVTYVKEVGEKEAFLGPDDLIVEDYPLFPKSMTSKLIMIDYPYNRKAKCLVRVTSPKQLGEIIKQFTNGHTVV